MNKPWESIAELLRCEVAEYGRLIQLFEEQQTFLFNRDAPGVLRTSDSIEAQVGALGDCRGTRERAVAEFAARRGLPAQATLRSLIPFIAPEAQPLIEALMKDLNRLVSRVRRTSRLNRLFLIRTIENHQELLRRIHPGSFSRTYAPNGRVANLSAPRNAALVAEG
jgi:hypothetical protein